jgi:hypothetical protein
MVSYTAYIAPLIVAGIAGFTVTSLAFNKLDASIKDSFINFKIALNLGANTAPILITKLHQQLLQNIMGFCEMLVAICYCFCEIMLIYPFVNSLLIESNSATIPSDQLCTALIVIAYIFLIFAIVISAIIYGYAVHFNNKTTRSPPCFSNDQDREESRKKLNP